MSGQCKCGSRAINDDPHSVLCDLCWRDAEIERLRERGRRVPPVAAGGHCGVRQVRRGRLRPGRRRGGLRGAGMKTHKPGINEFVLWGLVVTVLAVLSPLWVPFYLIGRVTWRLWHE